MKIFVCLIILFVFAAIGYSFKWKAKREQNFFDFLKDFTNYFVANINLFKNNVVAIIDNYNIMHKNKNAKYNDIFQKNGNIYQIEQKNISKYIKDESFQKIIYEFLKNMGSNEFEYEKKKADDFLKFLDEKLLLLKNEKMKKSDLNFKLFLAIGAVVCIIIW